MLHGRLQLLLEDNVLMLYIKRQANSISSSGSEGGTFDAGPGNVVGPLTYTLHLTD